MRIDDLAFFTQLLDQRLSQDQVDAGRKVFARHSDLEQTCQRVFDAGGVKRRQDEVAGQSGVYRH